MKNLLLLTTVLTTLMISIPAAHADVAGHLLIESSGIRKGSTTTRGVYRDRGKSSPKIAEGMRTDVGNHLLIESTGIRKSPTPTRGVYRDRGKSSPKIAPTCNVHLKQQTKCTGCTVCWFGTGHGMYRDRGKSSPKIAEGMRSDVLGHLLVEASGIRKGSTTTRGRLEHGPGLRK